jgi:DNA polymerase-3 subunit delta'
MKPSNLSWFSSQWDRFVLQKKSHQIPQAILLSGSQGIGKRQLATDLATYFLCSDSSEQACGQCKQCRWMSLHHHPDFYSITLEEEKKSISIQQIRDLIARLQNTPQQATHQVAIIQPADSMTNAAMNSLLKTLEEPNGNVVIILVTDKLHRLSATIISRCQLIRLGSPSLKEAQDWLAKQLGDESRATELLALNDHLPFLALENKDHPILPLLQDWDQLNQQVIDPIQLASKWKDVSLSDIIVFLQRVILDGYRSWLNLPTQYFAGVTHQRSPKQLNQLNTSLTEMKRLTESSANLNPQLLLEKLLIEWCRTC